MSYDIEKDGAKVAVLTFVKSAYRLGETILGIVDVNFAGGRTKVLKASVHYGYGLGSRLTLFHLQLSATLEAHEALPPTIPLITSALLGPGAARAKTPNRMKRVHSEYLCAFAMDTHRACFSLDIPADGTPAFGITAYDPDEGRGGLAWRVRMNFLVAVAPSPQPPHSGSDSPTELVTQKEGEQETLRTFVQDGPPGEWGSSSRASDSLAPLVRVDTTISPLGAARKNNAGVTGQLWSGTTNGMPTQNAASGGWASMFLGNGGAASGSLSSDIGASSSQTSFSDYNDNEGDAGDGNEGAEDGERRGSAVDSRVGAWMPVEVQTVECEVPVSIWPGATAFRPRESIFEC